MATSDLVNVLCCTRPYLHKILVVGPGAEAIHATLAPIWTSSMYFFAPSELESWLERDVTMVAGALGDNARGTYDMIIGGGLYTSLQPKNIPSLLSYLRRLLAPGGEMVLETHRVTSWDFASATDATKWEAQALLYHTAALSVGCALSAVNGTAVHVECDSIRSSRQLLSQSFDRLAATESRIGGMDPDLSARVQQTRTAWEDKVRNETTRVAERPSFLPRVQSDPLRSLFHHQARRWLTFEVITDEDSLSSRAKGL